MIHDEGALWKVIHTLLIPVAYLHALYVWHSRGVEPHLAEHSFFFFWWDGSRGVYPQYYCNSEAAGLLSNCCRYVADNVCYLLQKGHCFKNLQIHPNLVIVALFCNINLCYITCTIFSWTNCKQLFRWVWDLGPSLPQESIQWPNVLDPMKRQANLSGETGDGDNWRQNFRGKRDSPAVCCEPCFSVGWFMLRLVCLHELKLILGAHPTALAGS